MKNNKFAPFILGMILSAPAFSQVGVIPAGVQNVITAAVPASATQLTKEVLTLKSSGVLDTSNKYLRLLDKLLVAVEAEGMQRDWFVNDQVTSALNLALQSNNQLAVRNITLQTANKVLLSLSQGFIQPEMLGEKTLRRLYEFKGYSNSKLAKATKAELVEDVLAKDFKTVSVNAIYAELTKYENVGVESEDAAVNQLVERFRPKNANYLRLLAMYKTISEKYKNGEIKDSEKPKAFVTIAPPEYLAAKKKKNDATSILFARKRLELFGYPNNVTEPTYTEDLRTAIMALQDNNLLATDGILGPQTFGILSTPVEQILTRFKINLDRSRWLADEMKSEYVHINLAAQRLFYYKDKMISLSFRTINGAKDRPTPILSSNITRMILNPTWTTAPTPYFKDKTKMFSSWEGLNDVIEKRYTFKVNSMKVINDYNNAYKLSTGQEYPFMDVIRRFTNPDNTITTNEETWPAFMQLFKDEGIRFNSKPNAVPGNVAAAMLIVQRPGGEQNALGWIKFPLNDTNSIYMHDTNQRELFANSDRLMSSGCVRMEKPWDLAIMLLGGTKDETTGDYVNAKVDPATGLPYTIQSLHEKTVTRMPIADIPDPDLKIGRSVPVYMLYDTAQINDHGQMTLVKDNYGIDMDMFNLMMGYKSASTGLAQQGEDGI